jgi:hypothetical protein
MYGLNPSVPVTSDGETLLLWNLNPPHFHLVLLPFVWLPARVALIVWLLANGACLFAAVRLIAREADVRPTRMQRQVLLVAALAFIGTSTALITAHLSFLLFYLVTLSWHNARHGRWGRAGLWLGLSLSVKPFLLFLVPYFAVKRQWRGVASVVATVMVCFAVGLLVFGWENHLAWKSRLLAAEGWAWLSMNASLLGALTRTFTVNMIYTPLVVEPTAVLFAVWAVLCLLIVLLTYAAAAAESPPRGVDRAFAVLPVAALLISPLGWTYYFWLPLGPLLLLALGWWRQPREQGAAPTWSRRLLLAAITGALFPLHFVDLCQPSPLATLLIGSVFFWSLLLTWLALTVDGLRLFTARREQWS